MPPRWLRLASGTDMCFMPPSRPMAGIYQCGTRCRPNLMKLTGNDGSCPTSTYHKGCSETSAYEAQRECDLRQTTEKEMQRKELQQAPDDATAEATADSGEEVRQASCSGCIPCVTGIRYSCTDVADACAVRARADRSTRRRCCSRSISPPIDTTCSAWRASRARSTSSTGEYAASTTSWQT